MAAVPVPEPVPLPVIVGVTLGLLVVDAVPEFEPVDDGLTPDVSDDVGVNDGDGDSEFVVDGVFEDVGVLDGDDVGVPEALRVAVVVALGVSVLLGVIDALAPGESELVGVADGVVDDVSDWVDELLGVTLDEADIVELRLDVFVGVTEGLDVDDAVIVPLAVLESVEMDVPDVIGDVDIAGDAVAGLDAVALEHLVGNCVA